MTVQWQQGPDGTMVPVDPNTQPQTGATNPAPIVINVPPTPPPPPAQGITPEMQAWFDAERERVRTEEKNKLYPQMEELKNQIGTLTKEREDRLAAEQAEQQRLADEAKAAAEAEMSANERLEQFRNEQELRFRALEEERNVERALRLKEQEFAQIQQYRLSRLAEESDNIAPQLADFVRGASQEEIDRSIDQVKQKTAEIQAEVQEAYQGQRRQIPLPVAGGPAVDMAAMTGSQRSLTAAEIDAMSLDDYGQVRSQLMGAASERVRTLGLYAP